MKVQKYSNMIQPKQRTVVFEITKSVSTSKDILVITDTPDVAVWNKPVQIKSNDANMVKHSKERENERHRPLGLD